MSTMPLAVEAQPRLLAPMGVGSGLLTTRERRRISVFFVKLWINLDFADRCCTGFFCASAPKHRDTVLLSLPTAEASTVNKTANINLLVNIYRKAAGPRRRRETVVHCSVSHSASATQCSLEDVPTDRAGCAGAANAAAAAAPV
jgi:hypothetical protein